MQFSGAVNWFEVAPAGGFIPNHFPNFIPKPWVCAEGLVGEGWCFLGVCMIHVVYILHFVWC